LACLRVFYRQGYYYPYLCSPPLRWQTFALNWIRQSK